MSRGLPAKAAREIGGGGGHYDVSLIKSKALLYYNPGSHFEHISGSPVARVHITPKEIIYNKPHPSVILYLHDEAARCTILQLMQEIKRDVLYRRMNIRPAQQGSAVPKTRIQAHLIGTVNKLSRLLEYQNLRSGNEAKRILDKLNEIISARVE